MSTAKTEFIEKIRCLYTSISSEAVTNKALVEREHNSIAKMFRNGLAVVSFASLEDFIKKRISEGMYEVSRCAVHFSNLPEKLQKAATIEVISALNYQLSILEKEDKIPYIQEQTLKISSTANSSYELSNHTFCYAQSNVNTNIVGDSLKSFNVEDPWRHMSEIASNIGLTGLPLVESFKNAAQRRHKAAHVSSTDTPQNDISQFVNEAFAIALGYDALLSKAIQKFRENNSAYLSGTSKVDSSIIEYRLLKHQDGFWKEFVNGSSRAYRRSNNLDTFKNQVKNRASIAKQLFVEYDSNGLISDWECY